ncbi:PREDICTED: U6 snRNA-associated Sm-like protein LSm1 [Amphimedon queenslandica]|uniref:U6 snRNA-associated Sm-like protein LSm1 n=2 Tax=Amphimedon queenslandica TaxID=400682 RepID=A0AAN0IJP4_AMPQE|nr:PREDICTED: U6 snRNA-associated Sm-like protein LSm1 [Amphimedon queenslandica]|eukprot:XP_003391415.1 PREDICTED: U6 snRNA-associated Sm-like protein LSm1 [Amphimedon queenslandica]
MEGHGVQTDLQAKDSFDGKYIPGTASLIAEVDKRILVVLRGGRTLIGYLRSIDQFANLLLQDTVERIHVGKKYGDIPRGIFLVRGENMVLCGEIEKSLEESMELEKVSIEEIIEAQRQENEKREKENKRKEELLRQKGLPVVRDESEDILS